MPTRIEVRFPSAGEECHAWLYLPDGEAPFPAVAIRSTPCSMA